MSERLLIVLGLVIALLAGWQLLRVWQRARLRSLASQRPFDGIVTRGVPTVVAFTLPSCGECRSRQAPALERLRVQLGTGAAITTLSAEAHPDLVSRLGILTVPATVVLDAAGTARFLNLGFADETRLQQQLSTLT